MGERFIASIGRRCHNGPVGCNVCTDEGVCLLCDLGYELANSACVVNTVEENAIILFFKIKYSEIYKVLDEISNIREKYRQWFKVRNVHF